LVDSASGLAFQDMHKKKVDKEKRPMRIAISADSKNHLDSVVSPHFGRCPYFILVDLLDHDVTEVQEVENPYYGRHEPGQVPGFINSLEADVMLTGGMGGRAIMFFQQFGIEGVTGAYGTVRQSIERYLGGELRGAAPCRESEDHGHGSLPAEGEYEEDELGRLREEADMLRQQLEDVTRRLEQVD
jgi:predicted Fe-Mo cluster-binding NifX family protein